MLFRVFVNGSTWTPVVPWADVAGGATISAFGAPSNEQRSRWVFHLFASPLVYEGSQQTRQQAHHGFIMKWVVVAVIVALCAGNEARKLDQTVGTGERRSNAA
jgi:hypothetical protein